MIVQPAILAIPTRHVPTIHLVNHMEQQLRLYEVLQLDPKSLGPFAQKTVLVTPKRSKVQLENLAQKDARRQIRSIVALVVTAGEVVVQDPHFESTQTLEAQTFKAPLGS